MGQYQQWLHYREVDRFLRTQLEELAEEFARLRTREQLLQQMLHPVHSLQAQEQPAPEEETSLLQAHNKILHVLISNLNGHSNHIDSTPANSGNGATEVALHSSGEVASAHSNLQDEPAAATSQSVFARSNFLSAGEQPLPTSSQPLLNSNESLPPIPPVPHTPYSESMLLPEDMGAFIEEHTQTEPRMELPWWLRNAALQNANGPIDQESMRTNRLIQRWIERWGRQTDATDVQELPAKNGENGENRENQGNGQNSKDREEDPSS